MNKGFTLIELLVVVLIIGILSAIALPQYTTAVEKSRSAEALTLMGTLRYSAERYRLQNSAFPGADMTVLDIEMPNGTTTGAHTKNFKITATGTGTTYTISAQRGTYSGSTFTAGTGSLAYTLQTVVNADGTATRSCNGTGDAAKTCKAIAAGNTTNF